MIHRVLTQIRVSGATGKYPETQMRPSLSKLAQSVGLQPEAPKRAQSVLFESYLSLIDSQNRRLAAEERAMEDERLYLAELPEQIADLDRRISRETAFGTDRHPACETGRSAG